MRAFATAAAVGYGLKVIDTLAGGTTAGTRQARLALHVSAVAFVHPRSSWLSARCARAPFAEDTNPGDRSRAEHGSIDPPNLPDVVLDSPNRCCNSTTG